MCFPSLFPFLPSLSPSIPYPPSFSSTHILSPMLTPDQVALMASIVEGSLQLRCNWGPRIKRISLQYHMSHHAPSDPKPWLLFQANTYTQWVVQYSVHRCGSGPYIACDSPISRLTVWREHTCRLVIGLRSFRHYPGSESNPRPCDCKTCALTD